MITTNKFKRPFQTSVTWAFDVFADGTPASLALGEVEKSTQIMTYLDMTPPGQQPWWDRMRRLRMQTALPVWPNPHCAVAYVLDFRLTHRFEFCMTRLPSGVARPGSMPVPWRLMRARDDESERAFRERVLDAATGLRLASSYLAWLKGTYHLPPATRKLQQTSLRKKLLAGYGVRDALAVDTESADDAVLRWLKTSAMAFAGGSAIDGAWVMP